MTDIEDLLAPPYTRLPLVHDDTDRLPDATMRAIREDVVAGTELPTFLAAEAADESSPFRAELNATIAEDLADPESVIGSAAKATIVELVAVPDFRGVVLAGQSNERGATTDGSASVDTTTARVKQWSRSAGKVKTGLEPLEHPDPAASLATGIGPGVTLAKALATQGEPPILLIPGAFGSSGFVPSGGRTWDVDDTTTATNLGRNLVADMKAAAAAHRVRFDVLHWTQGENDTSLTEAQYAAKLDRLIAYIKAEVPEAARIVAVIGGMVPKGVETSTGRQGIHAAHRETPYRVEGTAFVKSPEGADTYRTDDVTYSTTPIHFQAAAQRTRGDDAAAAVEFAHANFAGVDPYQPAAVSVWRYGAMFYAEIEPNLGRVTDYNVEYRVNGGAWTAIAAARSLRLRRPMIDTLYSGTIQARVRAVNEQGLSEWVESPTIDVTSLIPVPSTHSAATVTGAFGLRRLVAGYAGSAIQVRDVSDGSLHTIGFRADGTLDETALLAVGSNVTVRTLYDQSGNGRDFLQTTDALQPEIVSGGTVWKINGRPALRLGGASAWRMTNGSPYLCAAGASTLLAVLTEKGASATGTMQVYSEYGGSAQWTPIAWAGSDRQQYLTNDNAAAYSSVSGLLLPKNGRLRQYTARDTGTELRLWLDGDASGSAAYTRSGRTWTLTGRGLGTAAMTSSTIYLSEVIEYGIALSEADRRAIELNQRDFHATLGKLIAV